MIATRKLSNNRAAELTSRSSIGSGQSSGAQPIINMARNHRVNMKSASVEANNRPSIRCSSINIFETDCDDSNNDEDDQSATSNEDLSHKHRQQPSKSKNFLSIGGAGGGSLGGSGGGVGCIGGGLKPSVSTSCLYTATEQETVSQSSDTSNTNSSNTSNTSALVCIPTRASLTHQWKKLKTPNKCRECNILVYFNGRECSFCGFVAHKKCVITLVIKCSGQKIKLLQQQQQSSSERKAKDKSQNVTLTAQIQNSFKRTPKPPTPMIKPIFGQPIQTDTGEQIIDFMRRFIYEIDTRGLTSRGIYRVSSIKSKVDKLCNYYDQNLSCLIDLSSFHPNIIANGLKTYLRKLPDPLLTHLLYDDFIELAKKYHTESSTKPNEFKTTNLTPLLTTTHNQLANVGTTIATPTSPKTVTAPAYRTGSSLPICRVQPQPFLPQSQPLPQKQQPQKPRPNRNPIHKTRATSSFSNDPNYNPALVADFMEIVDLLPPINHTLIAIIMRHLKRIADMSEENQMSAKNLSIIFGPTLLSSSNKSLAIVDNIHQARAVELMITWANQIFPQYENYESKVDIVLADGSKS